MTVGKKRKGRGWKENSTKEKGRRWRFRESLQWEEKADVHVVCFLIVHLQRFCWINSELGFQYKLKLITKNWNVEKIKWGGGEQLLNPKCRRFVRIKINIFSSDCTTSWCFCVILNSFGGFQRISQEQFVRKYRKYPCIIHTQLLNHRSSIFQHTHILHKYTHI